MAGKFYLYDPLKQNKARVNEIGCVYTSPITPTPRQLADITAPGETRIKYFNSLLGVNGNESVVNNNSNMNVDGSTTPQEFYLQSVIDYNFVVTYIVVIIADGTVNHDEFGGLGALTNGWDLHVTQSGQTTPIIENAVTSGQAMVQTGVFRPWGTASDVNMIAPYAGGGGFGSGDEAVIIKIPFTDTMPYGLVFPKGTTDRLTSVVKDDLTGLIQFSVRVIGYKD